MNRFLWTLVALFCSLMQVKAQSLTEAEVTEKMYQALALCNADKYSEALELFLIAGENTKLQRTEMERQTYVFSQAQVCMCYGNLERYEEAYTLAKKLLQGKLNNEERGLISRFYAVNGYMYASEFIKRDDKGHADYEYGRKILEEIKPYADGEVRNYILPLIPLSWYFEGAKYQIKLKHTEALEVYNKALEGFCELGRESDKILVWQKIASVKKSLCDRNGSYKAYNEALALARKNGKVAEEMKILEGLWKLSTATGNLERAKIYTASMDSLAEVSTDAGLKYIYYNLKGDEARGRNDYNLAEQWFLRGMDIAEEMNRKTLSSALERSCKNLSELYAAAGRYDDALKYSRKALDEFRRIVLPAESGYYLPYMDIAKIYKLKGEKESCFACIDSLFLSEPRMEEPKECHYLYTTRASCYAAFGDYSAALADYQKADEILARKYPQSDKDRIDLMALIGGMEHQLGHYAESERWYKLYAEHTKKLYGENSMEYIDALLFLANAEGFSEQIDAGCRDYISAATILKERMKKHISYMSVTERESLWEKVSSLFMSMTPYALKAELYQTPFTKSCYDALVLSKSFLLESERSLFDVVKKEGTDDDIRDYMRLSLMKNQIKEMEKNYGQFSDSILDLSQRADRLANYLANRCRGFARMTDFMDIDYEVVKQTLKPNETLLDFTDFMSKSAGRKYAVYIINKTDENPLVKPLFAERQIDSLGIARPDMYYDKDYAPEVLKLLWEPLKAHIAEGSTVYYVPSQLLFQISLESLPLADGSLLGSHYNFVRLSSARELVKAQKRVLSSRPQSAVLYGGLQYDLQPTAMIEQAKKYDLSDLLVMRGDNTVRGDSLFRELPGSKREVIEIESILQARKWQVTPYVGMEGTEESFLNMHGKAPQVLQIATHGFYYTPDRAETVNYLKGYSDAMSLSGIVLSGGNAAWLGKVLPDGVLDGILTANNIARLDLSGTEMVVLSACQSGRGKATPEGLYGLQRAFKKAGVGTMVMALWNVSDKVATDFMITFYERLASKQCRWNKRKAFERAKSVIRDKYPDPFHWAAFVMLD